MGGISLGLGMLQEDWGLDIKWLEIEIGIGQDPTSRTHHHRHIHWLVILNIVSSVTAILVKPRIVERRADRGAGRGLNG